MITEMSERGQETQGKDSKAEEKVSPVSSDTKQYFDIVKPLYEEEARLTNELKNLPDTPESAVERRRIKEGIGYVRSQEDEVRRSLFEGRISSFGEPGPRLTPSEIALNANKSKLGTLSFPVPVKGGSGQEEKRSMEQKSGINNSLEESEFDKVRAASGDYPKLEVAGSEFDEARAASSDYPKPEAPSSASVETSAPRAGIKSPDQVAAQSSAERRAGDGPSVESQKRSGETAIKFPEDLSIIKALQGKLSEYKERLIKAAPTETGTPAFREYWDAFYKSAILEELLTKGRVDAEFYRRLGSVDASLFSNAYGVIEDYVETGGKRVGGGTGLFSRTDNTPGKMGAEHKPTPERKAIDEDRRVIGETHEGLMEEARNKQAAAYSAWRAGKKSKKSEEELDGLLKAAEDSRYSHYELIARHVSSLMEAKRRELEGKSPEAVKEEMQAYQGELFNEHFIKEYERSQALEIETFPPKEKSAVQKAVNWWMRQPQWKRLIVSTGISLAVGVGTGAIATVPAVLVFGGAAAMRRWISGGASVGAGAATELGLKTWDKIFGGEKKGLAYQEKIMHGKFGPSTIAEFIKAQQEYAEMRTLAEQREKRRRIGILAAQVGAGVATSFILGHHADAVAKALHLPLGEKVSSGAAGTTVPGAEHAVPGAGIESHIPSVGHGGAEHATEATGGVPSSGLEHAPGVAAGTPPAADVVSEHAAVGAGATAPAEAFVMPTGDFTKAAGDAFLSRLHNETLTPSQITSVLYDRERIEQLAQATNTPFNQLFENLKTGLAYSQHTTEWLVKLNNETLEPADIITALSSKEWVGRLAEIKGISPADMQKTLEDSLQKSQEIQSWMKNLDAGQLDSAQVDQVLSDPSWVNRLATLDNVTPDKMHGILEQALNMANVRELFQNITAGKVGSASIKAAMENPSWMSEAAKINNTSVASIGQALQTALSKAMQAGK